MVFDNAPRFGLYKGNQWLSELSFDQSGILALAARQWNLDRCKEARLLKSPRGKQ